MSFRDDITQLLERAVRAPSGDNLQPWRFVVRGTTLEIHEKTEADTSIIDYKEYASYVALGALIENIVLLAPEYGYEASVALFPETHDSYHTANITLEKASPSRDALVAYIPCRGVNRGPYRNIPLSEEERTMLRSLTPEEGAIRLSFVEKREEKKKLAAALALPERLFVEHPQIHAEFIRTVRWSEKEVKKFRDGLPLKSIAYTYPERTVIRLLGVRGVRSLMDFLGIGKVIALSFGRRIRRSSAVGAVMIYEETPEAFVRAGRFFERVWLTLAKYHLDIQPHTGIPFIARHLRHTKKYTASERLRRHIFRAETDIREVFGLAPHESVAMVFRMGHATRRPPVTTLRKEPEIEFIS